MTNIVIAGLLSISLFTFVINNFRWSLNAIKAEVTLLESQSSEFVKSKNLHLSQGLEGLKIGELE